MITEWVTAAATALVNAAATDAWQTARDGFAQLLSRSDTPRRRLAVTLLDATAAEIEQADDADVDRVRRTQLQVWQTRLRDLLDKDPEVVTELRALTDQITTALRLTGYASIKANRGGVIKTNTVHAEGADSLAINRMDHSTIRKYHIGSIRFGTGGLVGLIAIAIVLLGGSTAGVVYAVTPRSINLDQLRGGWNYHQQGAGKYLDAVLTVDVPTFDVTVDIYDRAEASGERTGIEINCKGIVTAGSGEAMFHVQFRAHQPIGNATNLTSQCPDWFTGSFADSGRVLELSSPSGQPIRFQRS
jgi:hypothetical protein